MPESRDCQRTNKSHESYPSLDPHRRESVRRSIEHIHQASRLGYAGCSSGLRWTIPYGGSTGGGYTQQRCIRQFAGYGDQPTTALESADAGNRQQPLGSACPGRVERLDRRLEDIGKEPSPGPDKTMGPILLIIDVQSSKYGAIEEVCVHEGDSVFLLADAFISRHGLGAQHVRAFSLHIRKKVQDTGFIVAPDGRCWPPRAIAPPTENEVQESPLPNSAQKSKGVREQQQRAHSGEDAQSSAINDRRRGSRQTAIDTAQGDCNSDVTGRETHKNRHILRVGSSDRGHQERKSGSPGCRGRCRNDIAGDHGDGWGVEAYGESDGYALSSRAIAGLNNYERDWKLCRPRQQRVVEGTILGEHSDEWGDDGGTAEAVFSVDGRTRITLDGFESDEYEYDDDDGRTPDDGFDEEERAFRRARVAWSEPLLVKGSDGNRGKWRGGIESEAPGRDGYRRGRRSSAEPLCAPEGIRRKRSVRRALGVGRCGGFDHRTRDVKMAPGEGGRPRLSNEPSVDYGAGPLGWESAPDDVGRMNRPTRWRQRRGLGRRSMSRDALRQMRVSERLHRQEEVLARKRENARRHRDALLREREIVTRSGRLNLCPKTRELTDDSPRYIYLRNKVAINDDNGGERSGKAVAPVHGLLGHRAVDGHYRDAGDRLYSEWEASRRKRKPRGSQQDPDVEGRGGSSREAWSCPKCGAFNRTQDRTCQTVTGIAFPAQELRPGTWCRESLEKLGRAASIASASAKSTVGDTEVATAAAGVARATKTTNLRNVRKKVDERVGRDGLRRCGTPQPSLFKPTPVARLREDCLRPRPRGELLFESLYRNSPTPSRRRAQKVLEAERKARLTFTPTINEKSARLAEVHEARRELLSFNVFGSSAGSSSSSSSSSSTSNGNDDKTGGTGEGTVGEKGKSSTDGSASRIEETVTKPFKDHRHARGVGKRAPSKAVAKSLRLYSEHAEIERRKQQMRKDFMSRSCPFAPDIGMSTEWPSRDANTEEFFRRLHNEHREQQRKHEARRLMLYGNGQNESSVTLMVDPVTGQRLFCPTINKRRRPPRRLHGKQEGDVGGLDGNGGGSGSWNFGGPAWAGGRASEEKGGESRGKHVFSRLWEQSLALERRRKADAREREEARKARASERHVTGRSAALVRAMRMRSLLQTYRALLASVEYARLPEGLSYEEAMDSITAKINAIFDNDNDAWQDMTLEVAKADPSVLKPELADIVASALAGHKEETLGLRDFCTLLDASVETLATTRGPTAHLFAPDGGRSTSVAEAEAAAAERVQREEEAEMREMTFHPKIDQKSVAIATMLGRDGSKSIEEILREEACKKEMRRNSLHQDQEALFHKKCPFTPKRFSSNNPTKHHYPRCRNEMVAGASTSVAQEAKERE